MVHFRTGDALQPLLTDEEMGKVAWTCRFACGALCEELYELGLGRSRARLISTSRGGKPSSLPTPSDEWEEARLGGRQWAPTLSCLLDSLRTRLLVSLRSRHSTAARSHSDCRVMMKESERARERAREWFGEHLLHSTLCIKL